MKAIVRFIVGGLIAVASMVVSRIWPDWAWSAGWLGGCCYFWLIVLPKRFWRGSVDQSQINPHSPARFKNR